MLVVRIQRRLADDERGRIEWRPDVRRTDADLVVEELAACEVTDLALMLKGGPMMRAL